MRILLSLLLFTTPGCGNSEESPDQAGQDMPTTVMVHDGWVRAVGTTTQEPGDNPITSTAAYFILHNATDSDVTLVAVESSAARSAELHETRLEEGLMQMRPVDGIPVPANSHVELAPGSLHVMLVDLRRQVVLGDILEITLHFDDGSTLVESLAVRNGAEDHQHSH